MFGAFLALASLMSAPVDAQGVLNKTLASIASRLELPLIIPGDGIIAGNSAFFVADDGAHGSELWRTNGTADGTHLVRDILEGIGDAAPTQLVALNDRLYFQASDGATGRELWTSDGTPEGTRLVRDINPGPRSALPAELIVMGNRLYFRAYTAETGWELWCVDEQEELFLVRDIAPGPLSASPSYLTELNGHLYFRAFNESAGAELWTSDGTPEGTLLIKDLVPGQSSGAPYYLNAVDGFLYFRAFDAVAGAQVWVSDGTEAGTLPLTDHVPGEARLHWLPPTTNIDGTPLTDLIGYKIFYGTSPVFLDRSIEIYDPQATSHLVPFLTPGLYFFAMRTLNSEQVESETSSFVTKRIF